MQITPENSLAALGLEGRVAIITGAARGLGRTCVAALRARGAVVVASDCNPSVGELENDGVVTFIGDVSLEETAIATLALAMQRFGRVDILVNNAGRTLNKPLLETSADEWDAVMAVNARGSFLHAREAVRAMVSGGGGVIVNIASIASTVALKETSAYAASKGAVAQLTKVIAVEYGGLGIRANAVAPGVVETDILEGIVPDSRATLASYGAVHPLGRVGQVHEIAEVVAFLASPASSFMTGAIVAADGGYTAL
ncbi:SDR family NAD(P)-dependent oxidoreductase [Variovorax boronicumulans]|uniref:SDR family NAD(P)-dependent oxidoreductase n=1 Tax=Variovorax boronicumulans TaxID=436515 RepID=UPI001C5844A4